jgi:hypothetical protein
MYATISAFQKIVNQCANCYNAAYHALSVLDPDGTWAFHLQN